MIIDSPIISGSYAATGSLNQTGNVVITGSLTVTGTINGSITGSITTASYALNAETLDGLDSTSFTTTSSFNTVSGSFSTRVTNLESFSSSLDATFATDAQLTAVSQSFSSSLSTVSGSLASRVANNEATGSSLTTASSSFSTRTTNLETASGSFSTRVTNNESNISSLQTASGSFSTRTTNLETASGSFSTRVTSAEGSVTSLNSKTGSYATTGSNAFNGSQTITGSLTTTGQIIAQTINVQQVTSSIVYSSGSNIFGNSVSNTQQFTGSVSASGSLIINNSVLYVGGTNIGIGGTNPNSAKLVIYGSAAAASNVNLLDLKNGSDGGIKILFSNSVAAELASITAGVTSTGAGTDDGTLIFSTAADAVATEKMRITSGGSVGIGTTSPDATLAVHGQFKIKTTNSDGNENRLFFNPGGAGDPAQLYLYNEAQSNTIYVTANGASYFNGGNVGIGSTSPAYKLDVNGAINSSTSTVSGTGSLNLGTTSESRIAGIITATASPSYSATSKIGFSVTTWGAGSDYGPTEVMAIDMRGADSKNPVIWMNPFGGSVGIGTTSPNNIFTIYAASSAIYTQWIQSGTGTTSTDGLRIGLDASSNGIINLNEGTALITSVDGSERMRITNGGNVGIGTTSPGAKFHVFDSTTAAAALVRGTGANLASSYMLQHGGGGSRTQFDGTWYMSYGSAETDFGLTPNLGGGLIFWFTSGSTTTNPMTLKRSGDALFSSNVGIGTTSPSGKLDISSGLRTGTTSGLFIGADSDTSAGTRTNDTRKLGLIASPHYSSATRPVFGIAMDNQVSNNFIYIGGAYSGYNAATVIAFSTGATTTTETGTERMRITSGGNVGIGTTSPTSRLEVTAPNTGATTNYASKNIIANSPLVGGYTGAPIVSMLAMYDGSIHGADIGYLYDATGYGLAFSVNNDTSGDPAEAMRINRSGNVGIGTTSPSSHLHVHASGGPSLWLTAGGSGTGGLRIIKGDSGTAYINNQDSVSMQFQIAGDTKMIIEPSGNTGIGTTSPATLLQAGSTTVSSGGGSLRVYGFDGAADFYTTRQESDWNAALYLHNNPSGAVGNGTGILFRARSSSTDSRVQGAIFTSWTTSTDGSRTAKLVLQTVNSGVNGDRITILGNGNVGIGTTSPLARLDLGSSSNGNRVTWDNYSNVFSEYSSGDLWLSSNFYGNLGSSGYVTSTTATFGAAGIAVSGTGGGLNGVIKFFVDNAASKTAGASFTPSERMRITSNGDIGIGTTSPIGKQHNIITSNGTALYLNNSTGGGGAFVDLDFGTYTTNQAGYANAGATIRVIDDGNFSGHITFRTKGGAIGASQTEQVRIQSNGNVGIGTTTPLAKFHTDGNGFFRNFGVAGYTAYIGSISPGNVGDRYLHVQFNTIGSMMLWIKVFGYVYTTNVIEGLGGGYVGGGTGGLNQAFQNGAIVAQYQNSGYVEIVVDTVNTATTNRWGSITFLGGTDSITTIQPLEIRAYSWTSTTTRVY